MATVNVSKVLSSLPETLVANTLYLVRVGTGFDFYVTDDSGLIAYQSNPRGAIVVPLTESEYAALSSGEKDDATKVYVTYPDP